MVIKIVLTLLCFGAVYFILDMISDYVVSDDKSKLDANKILFVVGTVISLSGVLFTVLLTVWLKK